MALCRSTASTFTRAALLAEITWCSARKIVNTSLSGLAVTIRRNILAEQRSGIIIEDAAPEEGGPTLRACALWSFLGERLPLRSLTSPPLSASY